MNNYLKETSLLNFNDPSIQSLILGRGWREDSEKNKILSVYNYVRDDIRFGYNRDDKIPASLVLQDGYGQCNTKGILFMALLRAVGVPCRFHGFTIKKELQKGAITGIWYKMAPSEIVHSWIEILYHDSWLNLEGFILDVQYLKALQNKYKDCIGSFCGFGVATDNFKNPDIYWNENDTYIQKEGIHRDLGTYDDPDSFFREHGQKLGFMKQMVYKNITRHSMNRNVNKIRNS